MTRPIEEVEKDLREALGHSRDLMDETRKSAEQSLRAQRWAGELLIEAGFGGHGGDRRSTNAMLLERFSVTPMQSSRYRLLASLGDDAFEAYLDDCKQRKEEITQAGALKLAKRLRAGQLCTVHSSPTELVTDLDALAGQQFACILADPPWRFDNSASRSAAADEYPTMDLAALAAMPVAVLASDNAHLHLWACNAMLPEALDLMRAWGFTYKGNLVWTKPQIGVGNYWRNRHELLLLGVRGKLAFANHAIGSVHEFPRGRHSEKPEGIRELIERVSPGPRLELFGRRISEGWTTFGNELLEVAA